MSLSQWLFPIHALLRTPSSSQKTLREELLIRAKGVEFLFRVGATLCLPLTASLTAAAFLHRFYMRYSLDDYHHYEIAAACIFLTTKTEESGRKLRDVASVCYAKATSGSSQSDEEERANQHRKWEGVILTYEETLLDALCFDFLVQHPHTCLVELFDVYEHQGISVRDHVLQFSWSIANDSLRTPLCLLFGPEIIAAACFVLAECASEGSNSRSLDERIAAAAPWKPILKVTENQVQLVADAVTILLDFYLTQSPSKDPSSDPRPLKLMQPPLSLSNLCTALTYSAAGGRRALYAGDAGGDTSPSLRSDGGATPASSKTPKTPLRGVWTATTTPERLEDGSGIIANGQDSTHVDDWPRSEQGDDKSVP